MYLYEIVVLKIGVLDKFLYFIVLFLWFTKREFGLNKKRAGRIAAARS